MAIDGPALEAERALGDAVAQHLVAPADAVTPGRSVLQRVGSVVAEHVGGEALEIVERERRGVGQPGFERPADLEVGRKLEGAPTRKSLHTLGHQLVDALTHVNHHVSLCFLHVPRLPRR